MSTIEEQFMDRLMDGEATMTDLAQEMSRHPSSLHRVARNLLEQGLIGKRLIVSVHNRPETRYFMVRTKKAA